MNVAGSTNVIEWEAIYFPSPVVPCGDGTQYMRMACAILSAFEVIALVGEVRDPFFIRPSQYVSQIRLSIISMSAQKK